MDLSKIETALDNVKGDIEKARQRCDAARGVLIQERNKLANMATTYQAVIQAIADEQAAEPDNVLWQFHRARRDKLIAESQSLKSVVQDALDVLPAEF